MIFGKIKRTIFGDVRKKASISIYAEVASNIELIQPENCTIEEYVYVGPNAKFQCLGNVLIRRGSIFGPNVSIFTANHNFRSAKSVPYDFRYNVGEVTIMENVWVGSHVIILPGVTVGEGAIIGAGSVVSKDCEPFGIYAGNPCNKIGSRDIDEYQRLKMEDKIYLKLKQKK